MAKKLFYETDEFKRLKIEEYRRLENTYFSDIEGGKFVDIEKGETETVIRPQVIKTQTTQYDGGNTYYELCQSILRDYRFRKDIHKTIFELHAKGKSERDISTWITENTEGSFSQKGINLLINRIKESYLKGAE